MLDQKNTSGASELRAYKFKLVPTDTKVTIKWFVYSGNEKIRYESTMRGTWGYDAECSCGWKTVTGGASRSFVEYEVEFHKRYDHNYTSKAGN